MVGVYSTKYSLENCIWDNVRRRWAAFCKSWEVGCLSSAATTHKKYMQDGVHLANHVSFIFGKTANTRSHTGISANNKSNIRPGVDRVDRVDRGRLKAAK